MNREREQARTREREGQYKEMQLKSSHAYRTIACGAALLRLGAAGVLDERLWDERLCPSHVHHTASGFCCLGILWGLCWLPYFAKCPANRMRAACGLSALKTYRRYQHISECTHHGARPHANTRALDTARKHSSTRARRRPGLPVQLRRTHEVPWPL